MNLACSNNHLELVAVLLSRGANVNFVNKVGEHLHQK
jgi:ankyrin repeat protein